MLASLAAAIEETARRREKQIQYNEERGVDPQPLRKRIADITAVLAREGADTANLLENRRSGKKGAPVPLRRGVAAQGAAELDAQVAYLNAQMLAAADELKFELAARLRDELSDLKKALRQMDAAGHVQ